MEVANGKAVKAIPDSSIEDQGYRMNMANQQQACKQEKGELFMCHAKGPWDWDNFCGFSCTTNVVESFGLVVRGDGGERPSGGESRSQVGLLTIR
jgi:hypothetical protein